MTEDVRVQEYLAYIRSRLGGKYIIALFQCLSQYARLLKTERLSGRKTATTTPLRCKRCFAAPVHASTNKWPDPIQIKRRSNIRTFLSKHPETLHSNRRRFNSFIAGATLLLPPDEEVAALRDH